MLDILSQAIYHKIWDYFYSTDNIQEEQTLHVINNNMSVIVQLTNNDPFCTKFVHYTIMYVARLWKAEAKTNSYH